MEDKISVKIYDTYTGKIGEFSTIIPGEISIYCCGPTVYNYAHIGNMRPVIFFDLVHRFFLELGYRVKMVSNYTDIDDKIITKSIEAGMDEKSLSEHYIASYEDSLTKLNILPLFKRPRVSAYMDDIIAFVDQALKEGAAYRAGDDIVFKVSEVADYGSLSKMKIEDLTAGSRIAVDSRKNSPLDFVLWKKTADQGIKFAAPFGVGRPGWHTECLVMINEVFGRPLVDIHGGGFDLKFPHHENERAQAEAIYHSPLANVWMHVGFLNMGPVKMSKSLGNTIFIKDFLENHDPDVFRLFVLKSHYRSPLVYTDEAILNAETEIKKYVAVLKAARLLLSYHGHEEQGFLIEDYYRPFLSALGDDFNVPNALVELDKIVKSLNSAIRQKKADTEIADLLFTFEKLIAILGLQLKTPRLTPAIMGLYREYELARKEKDFAASDRLRQQLIEEGIL